MKKILKAAGNAAKRVGAAALDLYRKYPARANSYILAGVLAGASALHIVVDPGSAAKVIEWVLPVLLLGEGTHHVVRSAVKR